MIQDNNIQLHQYGLVEKDKVFIDEVIKGTRESQRKGREPSKHFLYLVLYIHLISHTPNPYHIHHLSNLYEHINYKIFLKID